jgi:hypothetical protein
LRTKQSILGDTTIAKRRARNPALEGRILLARCELLRPRGRKCLALFREDCRFDLVETLAYQSDKYEVAVRARKVVETIPFLRGTLVKADDASETEQHKMGDVRSTILSHRWGGPFFL